MGQLNANGLWTLVQLASTFDDLTYWMNEYVLKPVHVMATNTDLRLSTCWFAVSSAISRTMLSMILIL